MSHDAHTEKFPAGVRQNAIGNVQISPSLPIKNQTMSGRHKVPRPTGILNPHRLRTALRSAKSPRSDCSGVPVSAGFGSRRFDPVPRRKAR